MFGHIRCKAFSLLNTQLGDLFVCAYLPNQYLLATCKCGNVSKYNRRNIIKRKNLCCANCAPKQIKHGHASTPNKTSLTYNSWTGMKSRCNNPAHPQFKYWGGKGVTVCERWNDNFNNFLLDMGERPSREMTLDRINGAGNYEPGNCRWATKKEQRDNTCERYDSKKPKDCLICHTLFVGKDKRSKFCGLKCSSISQNTKVQKSCTTCKKEFFIKKSRENRKPYCSKECYYTYLREHQTNGWINHEETSGIL